MAVHTGGDRKKNPQAVPAAKTIAGAAPREHRVEAGAEGRPWNFATVPVRAAPISFQPKLRISAVDDPLEREADALRRVF
jgi:hypothetical protein